MSDTLKEMEKAVHEIYSFKKTLADSRKAINELDKKKRKLMHIKKKLLGGMKIDVTSSIWNTEEVLEIIEQEKLRYSWVHDGDILAKFKQDNSIREAMKVLIQKLKEVRRNLKSLPKELHPVVEFIKHIREPVTKIYYALERQESEIKKREFHLFLEEYQEQKKLEKTIKKHAVDLYSGLVHSLKMINDKRHVDKELEILREKGVKEPEKVIAAAFISITALLGVAAILGRLVSPELESLNLTAVGKRMVTGAHGIIGIFGGVPAATMLTIYLGHMLSTEKRLSDRRWALAEKIHKRYGY